jgi:GxxExxY protein
VCQAVGTARASASGAPVPERRSLPTVEHELLTGRIIGCAMRVHRTLGPGFLESVYQHALAWELRLAKHAADCQRRLTVRYRGLDVGIFVPDVIVDERVILEIKAVERLNAAHEVQLVNYLTITGIEVGLLLNFGSSRLEVRRKFRRKDSASAQVRPNNQTG